MTIGSGLGGAVGIADESVYGTFVAPTNFYDVTKSDMKKVKTTVQGGGLANGRMAQPGSRRLVTSQAASGTIDLEVPDLGFLPIMRHMFGDSGTKVANGTAWDWTFALADNHGRSFSLQQQIPDTAGVMHAYSYLGCKVTDVEFQCSRDNLLTVTVTIDGQDVSETQTLATPSYLASVVPFSFKSMSVKMGTYGTEAAVSGVNKWDLKFSRSMDTGSYYANGNGLKAEPIMNGWASVTGSFDVDFVNKAQFADLFRDDTPTSCVVGFTGPTIATGVQALFQITVPEIFFDGDSPTLDSPAIVTGTYNFTGQYDGTHPLISGKVTSMDAS